LPPFRLLGKPARLNVLKRLVLAAAGLLLLLAAVLAFNTLRLEAEPLGRPPPPEPVDLAAVARLADAIRIPTVSADAAPSAESLAAFHALLERSFPRVHAGLRRESVGGGSLLYSWPGSDPAAPALLLAAHQDVVPIEPGAWRHPPFAGAVADGFVWGRGTLDDKGCLMAILEAAERLLAQGFRPRQTIYFAFGHDEEVGGEGARAIAALLRRRGVRIGLALDEGSALLDGVIAGVGPRVAMIGTAEKGYVSVELTATGEGGHSSQPAGDNAALSIARAVARIEESPMAVRITGPVAGLLDAVAPHSDGAMRVALANRWLAAPLVKRELLASPASAAALRTTTAVTILEAGSKDNVLPQRARAIVNHRILPGETVASVLAHDGAAVADPKVTVRALPGAWEPVPPVSTRSPAYRRLADTIRATFPDAVVAPGLIVGATDLRHYAPIAAASFRFAPFPVAPADLERIHGRDERIAVADYMRAIAFYRRLIAGAE
jgi:carboxypeptidase PM20D1